MPAVHPFTDSHKRYLQKMKMWRPEHELQLVGCNPAAKEEDASPLLTLREDGGAGPIRDGRMPSR